MYLTVVTALFLKEELFFKFIISIILVPWLQELKSVKRKYVNLSVFEYVKMHMNIVNTNNLLPSDFIKQMECFLLFGSTVTYT